MTGDSHAHSQQCSAVFGFHPEWRADGRWHPAAVQEVREADQAHGSGHRRRGQGADQCVRPPLGDLQPRPGRDHDGRAYRRLSQVLDLAGSQQRREPQSEPGQGPRADFLHHQGQEPHGGVRRPQDPQQGLWLPQQRQQDPGEDGNHCGLVPERQGQDRWLGEDGHLAGRRVARARVKYRRSRGEGSPTPLEYLIFFIKNIEY